MVPKVSDEHREERRRQILDGARRAFARHGYVGATVPLVEQEVGLSRGAIFSYYPSKLELFIGVAAADRQRIGELWLAHGFDAVVRHVGEEDPDWIGVSLEVAGMLRSNPELRKRWGALAGDVVEQVAGRYVELQARGVIRSDVSPETVLRFLGVVLDGLATQQGARFPIDVEGTLELVRSALAPATPGLATPTSD